MDWEVLMVEEVFDDPSASERIVIIFQHIEFVSDIFLTYLFIYLFIARSKRSNSQWPWPWASTEFSSAAISHCGCTTHSSPTWCPSSCYSVSSTHRPIWRNTVTIATARRQSWRSSTATAIITWRLIDECATTSTLNIQLFTKGGLISQIFRVSLSRNVIQFNGNHMFCFHCKSPWSHHLNFPYYSRCTHTLGTSLHKSFHRTLHCAHMLNYDY